MPVELIVESLEWKVKQGISVFSVKQVIDGMKVINWNKHKDKWNHSKGIQFPEPSSKKHIDILLGTDYPQFQKLIKEVKGKNGDSVTRLTPMGWVCVGQPVTPTTQLINFIKTFHVRGIEDLGYRFCRFLEIESEGTNTKPMMTAHEEKSSKVDAGFNAVQRWSI